MGGKHEVYLIWVNWWHKNLVPFMCLDKIKVHQSSSIFSPMGALGLCRQFLKIKSKLDYQLRIYKY